MAGEGGFDEAEHPVGLLHSCGHMVTKCQLVVYYDTQILLFLGTFQTAIANEVAVLGVLSAKVESLAFPAVEM